MNISFRNATPDDARAVIDIFNYFIDKSFAAYLEENVDISFFEKFYLPAKDLAFLIAENEEQAIGFGFIRPFRDGVEFKHTATITYFILPGFTGMGLGQQFLQKLETAANDNGITNILAHISSKNAQSLNFHKKHSFANCGRFEKIGIKNGEYFDMVWMQKFI